MKTVRIEVLVNPMTIFQFKKGVAFEDWAFPSFFNQYFTVLEKLGFKPGTPEWKTLINKSDNELEAYTEFDMSTLAFKDIRDDMLVYSVGVKFDAERLLGIETSLPEEWL